jgi:Family of unknown function (DUF6101)
MQSGGSPAGSGRALRLDPFALPVRFAASDAAADERVRHVELHRERVVVRRSLAGMRIALNMPVKAFAGVAIKLLPGASGAQDAVAVVLAHADPALALPLYVSSEAEDAMAEWRVWGSVLGLPLLVVGDDGAFREPFARIGGMRVEHPRPRRRRRSPLRKRRPSILMWRKAGRITDTTPVHRGEREIIARN